MTLDIAVQGWIVLKVTRVNITQSSKAYTIDSITFEVDVTVMMMMFA
jgi:hypothetical protein